MPLACFLTILSLRASTLPQLIFRPLTSNPSSAAFLKWSYTSAWCSSTLVGIQPTCRQVPPRKGSFSTTMVLRPSSPARMAATYPPGPLPIIATSYFATRSLPSGEPEPVSVPMGTRQIERLRRTYEGPYRDELGILAAARAGRNLAARQRLFTTEGTER